MADTVLDDIEITLRFRRVIDDGADINERGKDHLLAEVIDIDGSEDITNALVLHINDEIGVDIREHGIGTYKPVAPLDEDI
jgi:hypothetical protein